LNHRIQICNEFIHSDTDNVYVCSSLGKEIKVDVIQKAEPASTDGSGFMAEKDHADIAPIM
jgi:hypothetical protein